VLQLPFNFTDVVSNLDKMSLLLWVIQGQWKHFQTKYSGGITHSSRGCEAGDYPRMEDL